MKRRSEIVLVGAILVGVAAISSIKRAARSDAGSRGGGACCPMMSGMNLLPTNFPAGTNVANLNSALTDSETVTNRQRQR